MSNRGGYRAGSLALADQYSIVHTASGAAVHVTQTPNISSPPQGVLHLASRQIMSHPLSCGGTSWGVPIYVVWRLCRTVLLSSWFTYQPRVCFSSIALLTCLLFLRGPSELYRGALQECHQRSHLLRISRLRSQGHRSPRALVHHHALLLMYQRTHGVRMSDNFLLSKKGEILFAPTLLSKRQSQRSDTQATQYWAL